MKLVFFPFFLFVLGMENLFPQVQMISTLDTKEFQEFEKTNDGKGT
jgi:hypothetical protein